MNSLNKNRLLEWLEDFCVKLDCEEPMPPGSNNEIDYEEYYKRVGAYETQMIILRRLKHAIEIEKNYIMGEQ